ncbi:MAG: peptidase C11 [Anaerolineae bacterium]|nr:peptidase C11 [Anaerolineae bacterium]
MSAQTMTQDSGRKWTFMVYLAGDNNLERFGLKDLFEIKQIGSTDQVAIVAQFDAMSDAVTRRYYLTQGALMSVDCVAELPEVNTGDPAALREFVTWATETYPAEHYGLVLWNHGSGWKDDDIYRAAEARNVAELIMRGQVRGLASGRASRALFSTTLETLVAEIVEHERAVLFDDTSADFLDNVEMRQVLAEIAAQLGKPLDLVGFDACLMNMVEVAYQIRDLCRVIVGSQEVEPGDGWPYNTVMARLVSHPELAPEALGQAIVEAYLDFYSTRYPQLSVTQSALATASMESLGQAVHALGQRLLEGLGDRSTLGLVFGALRAAQTYTDREYIDLQHFCELLAGEDAGPIGQAAGQVIALLSGDTPAVIANGRHGENVANSHGVSIYFPGRVISPLYSRLEFARQQGWDEFLDAFLNP